jgi:hypothetical protein
VKIGKTLSINPGAYEEGMLMGAIIQLDPKRGIRATASRRIRGKEEAHGGHHDGDGAGDGAGLFLRNL